VKDSLVFPCGRSTALEVCSAITCHHIFILLLICNFSLRLYFMCYPRKCFRKSGFPPQNVKWEKKISFNSWNIVQVWRHVIFVQINAHAPSLFELLILMLFVYQPGIGTPASWEKGFSCSCLLEWFAWSKAEETVVEKTLNLDGYKLHKLRFRLEVGISWIFSRIAFS